MSGNQEDRGREQLDQVSPLYIDSFFPFMCVHLKKGSLSQQFQFLKHLGKLLRGDDAIRQTRGIKKTARFGDSCLIFVWKTNYVSKRTNVSQKLSAYFHKNWMSQKDVWRCYLENSAPPSVHFSKNSSYPHEVSLRKAQGTCALVVCYLHQMCRSNSNFIFVS